MCSDSKRKASDQLGSESPKKRVKSSYSETITPEAEGKPRVVPFPEKVCNCWSIFSEYENDLLIAVARRRGGAQWRDRVSGCQQR